MMYTNIFDAISLQCRTLAGEEYPFIEREQRAALCVNFEQALPAGSWYVNRSRLIVRD